MILGNKQMSVNSDYTMMSCPLRETCTLELSCGCLRSFSRATDGQAPKYCHFTYVPTLPKFLLAICGELTSLLTNERYFLSQQQTVIGFL